MIYETVEKFSLFEIVRTLFIILKLKKKKKKAYAVRAGELVLWFV